MFNVLVFVERKGLLKLKLAASYSGGVYSESCYVTTQVTLRPCVTYLVAFST